MTNAQAERAFISGLQDFAAAGAVNVGDAQVGYRCRRSRFGEGREETLYLGVGHVGHVDLGDDGQDRTRSRSDSLRTDRTSTVLETSEAQECLEMSVGVGCTSNSPASHASCLDLEKGLSEAHTVDL